MSPTASSSRRSRPNSTSPERPVRKEPTQARSRETVRRLLEAADAEFAEQGYHTAQVTRIAQQAQVSVGALYRFFPDKAALADALRDRYLEAAAQGYRDMLDRVAGPDDVLPTFATVLAFAADLQQAHRGYYRLTLDRLPDDVVSWASSVREQMVADFSATVRSVGIDASPSVEFVFTVVVEQVHAVLAGLGPDDADREERLRHLTRMVGLYVADAFGLDASDLPN